MTKGGSSEIILAVEEMDGDKKSPEPVRFPICRPATPVHNTNPHHDFPQHFISTQEAVSSPSHFHPLSSYPFVSPRV